jgi:hypothetical protein
LVNSTLAGAPLDRMHYEYLGLLGRGVSLVFLVFLALLGPSSSKITKKTKNTNIR